MPRRPLLLLLAGALLVPSGVAAAADGEEATDDEIAGTLVVAHGDHFAKGHADEGYEVHAEGDVPITLDVAGGSLDALVGEEVVARGSVEGTTLQDAVVTPADEGTTDGTVATSGDIHAMVSGTKKVGVLLMNFSDRTTEPWTAAQVDDIFFGPTGSVDQFYRTTSDSAVNLTGAVHGWYTIASSYTTCSYTTWESSARAAATAAGVNLNAYDYLVYMFPSASCGWSGLARVGASGSWINGTSSVYVIAHELGHNFGVWHSSTKSCTNSGVAVTLSATCTNSEYGDPFSVMGSALRTHHAGHSHRMGWATTPAPVANGTHRIARLHSGGSPQLLRVARGSTGTYFDLEVRSDLAAFDTYGTGNAVVNGLSIRLDSSGYFGNSSLLDMNPSTSTFADAALPVGQTFVDSTTGVSIRLDSIDATGAYVTTGGGLDGTPPSAPGNLRITGTTTNSVSIAWNASTDDVGVAGYLVYRNSTHVDSTAWLSFTGSGLAPATHYTWTVQAYDWSGNTAQASVAGSTAPAPAPPPPPLPPPPARPSPGVVTPWGPTIVRDGALVPIPHSTPKGVTVTAAALTGTGGGSWTVSADGAVYTSGDAANLGSLQGIPLNQPINAMAATPTGQGYWLAAVDGGIFAFGDARFFGSTGAITLNQPIVGMAPTPTNNGYWLVARDGGIFAFGDARFFGSTGGSSVGSDISGMVSSATGNGYSLITADGRVFGFGDE